MSKVNFELSFFFFLIRESRLYPYNKRKSSFFFFLLFFVSSLFKLIQFSPPFFFFNTHSHPLLFFLIKKYSPMSSWLYTLKWPLKKKWKEEHNRKVPGIKYFDCHVYKYRSPTLFFFSLLIKFFVEKEDESLLLI